MGYVNQKRGDEITDPYLELGQRICDALEIDRSRVTAVNVETDAETHRCVAVLRIPLDRIDLARILR